MISYITKQTNRLLKPSFQPVGIGGRQTEANNIENVENINLNSENAEHINSLEDRQRLRLRDILTRHSLSSFLTDKTKNQRNSNLSLYIPVKVDYPIVHRNNQDESNLANNGYYFDHSCPNRATKQLTMDLDDFDFEILKQPLLVQNMNNRNNHTYSNETPTNSVSLYFNNSCIPTMSNTELLRQMCHYIESKIDRNGQTKREQIFPVPVSLHYGHHLHDLMMPAHQFPFMNREYESENINSKTKNLEQFSQLLKEQSYSLNENNDLKTRHLLGAAAVSSEKSAQTHLEASKVLAKHFMQRRELKNKMPVCSINTSQPYPVNLTAEFSVRVDNVTNISYVGSCLIRSILQKMDLFNGDLDSNNSSLYYQSEIQGVKQPQYLLYEMRQETSLSPNSLYSLDYPSLADFDSDFGPGFRCYHPETYFPFFDKHQIYLNVVLLRIKNPETVFNRSENLFDQQKQNRRPLIPRSCSTNWISSLNGNIEAVSHSRIPSVFVFHPSIGSLDSIIKQIKLFNTILNIWNETLDPTLKQMEDLSRMFGNVKQSLQGLQITINSIQVPAERPKPKSQESESAKSGEATKSEPKEAGGKKVPASNFQDFSFTKSQYMFDSLKEAIIPRYNLQTPEDIKTLDLLTKVRNQFSYQRDLQHLRNQIRNLAYKMVETSDRSLHSYAANNPVNFDPNYKKTITALMKVRRLCRLLIAAVYGQSNDLGGDMSQTRSVEDLLSSTTEAEEESEQPSSPGFKKSPAEKAGVTLDSITDNSSEVEFEPVFQFKLKRALTVDKEQILAISSLRKFLDNFAKDLDHPIYSKYQLFINKKLKNNSPEEFDKYIKKVQYEKQKFIDEYNKIYSQWSHLLSNIH